jgi:hypothetical protein
MVQCRVAANTVTFISGSLIHGIGNSRHPSAPTLVRLKTRTS